MWLLRSEYQHFHSTIFHSSDTVETCVPWASNTTQQIDLAFNIFFMVYFFIRVREDILIVMKNYLMCFRSS